MPSRPSLAELRKHSEKLRARAHAALTRAKRLEATEAALERRRDTRRKLLLGGVLLRLVRADRRLQADIQDAVREHVATRPRDAVLFERSISELASDDEKGESFDPGVDAQSSLTAEKRDAHRKIILGGIALVLVRSDARLRALIDDAVRLSFASSRRDAELFGLHGAETYLERLGNPTWQARSQ